MLYSSVCMLHLLNWLVIVETFPNILFAQPYPYQLPLSRTRIQKNPQFRPAKHSTLNVSIPSSHTSSPPTLPTSSCTLTQMVPHTPPALNRARVRARFSAPPLPNWSVDGSHGKCTATMVQYSYGEVTHWLHVS